MVSHAANASASRRLVARLAFRGHQSSSQRVVKIAFTPNLQRHLPCPPAEVIAHTLSQALQRVFDDNPMLRDYLLDDQRRLRKHITIFVNARALTNRGDLEVVLAPGDEVFVFQALSGG